KINFNKLTRDNLAGSLTFVGRLSVCRALSEVTAFSYSMPPSQRAHEIVGIDGAQATLLELLLASFPRP
ncbi:hypothetical protein EGW83_09075, partial [Enterococcus faecium]